MAKEKYPKSNIELCPWEILVKDGIKIQEPLYNKPVVNLMGYGFLFVKNNKLYYLDEDNELEIKDNNIISNFNN